MTPAGIAWLSAGLTMGLAAVGAAIAIAMFGSKSLEALARQPEIKGDIQKLTVLGFAFIEALALYALLIAFVLTGKA